MLINYDTKVNKDSITYSMTNEKESFYDWMDRDNKKVDLIDIQRSKVLCQQIIDGKIIKEFSTTIDMDITIVEFKLKMRDYVSVYIPVDFDNENYFIDLEFLNEEIDKNKFK